MRESLSHDGRVASQAIFSEKVIIENADGEWICIKTSDGYQGWVPSSSLVSRQTPYETDLTVSRLCVHVYGVKDTEFGPIKTLPYGAKLRALDTTDVRWIQVELLDGTVGYIQKGDVLPEPKMHKKVDLVEFSKNFLGLPYTWGGRSSFGYDCSGFIQMLYSKIDIHLQRDARQQILDNRFCEVSVDKLEPGDLVFFGKAADKIGHVGMYIGNGQFIHATPRENKPWLRISNLSDKEWAGTADVYYPYRTMRQLIVE